MGLCRRRRAGIGLREIRRRRHGRRDAAPERRADRADLHPARSARLRRPGRAVRLGRFRSVGLGPQTPMPSVEPGVPHRPGRRGRTSSCASSRPMHRIRRLRSRSPAAKPPVHARPTTASRRCASPRRPIVAPRTSPRATRGDPRLRGPGGRGVHGGRRRPRPRSERSDLPAGRDTGARGARHG